MKKCTKCEEHKPFSEFGKRGKGFKSQCKLCLAKASKKRYENNPEKVKESSKNYREANPEKVKAATKKWVKENPEKIKSTEKKWRESNPEKVKAIQKRWYENDPEKVKAMKRVNSKKYIEANPEKVKEAGRKWRKENPEKAAAHCAKRRAAKLQATVGWANDFFIRELYAHSQLLTKMSGVEHHVDHIIPLIHLKVCGLHCEDNLRVITGSENHSKNNKFEIN